MGDSHYGPSPTHNANKQSPTSFQELALYLFLWLYGHTGIILCNYRSVYLNGTGSGLSAKDLLDRRGRSNLLSDISATLATTHHVYRFLTTVVGLSHVGRPCDIGIHQNYTTGGTLELWGLTMTLRRPSPSKFTSSRGSNLRSWTMEDAVSQDLQQVHMG